MCCAAYCSFGVASLGLTKNTENDSALIVYEDTHNRYQAQAQAQKHMKSQRLHTLTLLH
jgi:hypothetical protein